MADNVTLKAISPSSGAYEAGTVMATNQQPDGAHAQKVAVVDVHGHIANVQQIAAAMDGDEYGVITNAVIHGKSTAGGGSWVDVKVTPSGAITTDTAISAVEPGVYPFEIIDTPHNHLHEGEMYQSTYAPAALANGQNLDFLIKVGNLAPTSTPHFTIELDSTGETWLYLYEAPTTSADGTPQAVVNKNRNYAVTASTTTVFRAPTVTAVGTLLSAWIVGSGEKSGGQGRESIEWPLAPNTNYLIRNTAKNANSVCERFMWYEDTGA